jgi:hypothetical protein
LVRGSLCGVSEAYTGAGVPEETDESLKRIIATLIRSQGFSCDNPVSAQRESEYSKLGEDRWVLKCDNATYRVLLIPDIAADVEPID